MTARAVALGAVIHVMSAAPVCAHTVIDGVGGFPGGLLHPLLVPAHFLLLLTLGLLVGQQSAAHRRVLMPLFPASLVAAIVLITSAVALETQNGVLLTCAISGLAVAFGRALPSLTAVLLIAGGISLMLDSVPALTSVRNTLAALSGTAFSALALYVLVAVASTRMTQPWQSGVRRILGSWAAAGAILVLALRLAK